MKYIAVELSEREIQILQSALESHLEHDGSEEVIDLHNRMDNIYADFDLIPKIAININGG